MPAGGGSSAAGPGGLPRSSRSPSLIPPKSGCGRLTSSSVSGMRWLRRPAPGFTLQPVLHGDGSPLIPSWLSLGFVWGKTQDPAAQVFWGHLAITCWHAPHPAPRPLGCRTEPVQATGRSATSVDSTANSHGSARVCTLVQQHVCKHGAVRIVQSELKRQ